MTSIAGDRRPLDDGDDDILVLFSRLERSFDGPSNERDSSLVIDASLYVTNSTMHAIMLAIIGMYGLNHFLSSLFLG